RAVKRRGAGHFGRLRGVVTADQLKLGRASRQFGHSGKETMPFLSFVSFDSHFRSGAVGFRYRQRSGGEPPVPPAPPSKEPPPLPVHFARAQSGRQASALRDRPLIRRRERRNGGAARLSPGSRRPPSAVAPAVPCQIAFGSQRPSARGSRCGRS